ncbi:MAG: hypothetical protein KAV87_44855 [Desulfobacteraceae bacterium]|nr:hypothetical protein [Desulfobacteraceae bacterium]
MDTDPIITAEVLISDKGEDQLDYQKSRIVERLQELGFKILSVGFRSITIGGTSEVFEAVFESKLTIRDVDKSQLSDFGSIEDTYFLPEEPFSIPDELQSDVDFIATQMPPTLFEEEGLSENDLPDDDLPENDLPLDMV